MAARLAAVFAALSDPDADGHCLRIDSRTFDVWLDGECLGRPATFVELVDTLAGALNRVAIAESGGALLLHAAAASLAGRAVLVPAPSGNGKSTLVGELVANGFEYVADEIVAIDLKTYTIAPYPKPLILASKAGEGRIVAVPGVRGPADVSLILSPRLSAVPGRPRSVPRAEAVVLLAENAFNFHDHGVRGLSALAEVARRSDTYRIDLAPGPSPVGEIRALLTGGVVGG